MLNKHVTCIKACPTINGLEIPEKTTGVISKIDADGNVVIRVRFDEEKIEDIGVKMENIEDHFSLSP